MSYSQYQQLPASVATPASAAETAIVSCSPALVASADVDQNGLVIRGYLNVTTGATATAAVIRCRRGVGTGGALIGVANTHTIGAAVSGSIPFSFNDLAPATVDTPPQYTITLSVTGQSGAGTVNDGCIEIWAPVEGVADLWLHRASSEWRR